MKYVPGRSAMLPLMFLAIVTRLFCAMAVEYSGAHNAAWICPLIGLILYLPFAFALQRAAAIGNDSAWGNLEPRLSRPIATLILLAFAMLLLLDGASMIRMTASTASYSIGDKAVVTLAIPLALLTGAMILLGPDATGHNARLGLYILGVLMLIIALVQIPAYRPGWLVPLLGGGIPALLTGGLRCAGYMALLTLCWMLAVPDRGKCSPALCGAIAAAVAALLLLFLQMLSPTFVETELLLPARLELILNNGRIAVPLQLVYLLVWYGGFLHLISAETVTAACLLKRLIPGLKPWILALFIPVAAFLLAESSFIQELYSHLAAQLLYPVLGVLLLAAMSLSALSKGGGRACAKAS